MDYAGSINFHDDSALLSVPNVEVLSDKSTEDLVKEVQEKWPDYNIEPEYEFIMDDRVVHVKGSASMHEIAKHGHVHAYDGECLKRRVGLLCVPDTIESDDLDLDLED